MKVLPQSVFADLGEIPWFPEREIKIMDYHDKGYTQEMIADKFGNSVRTIQREAARINKIYTDRGLPKRLLWNSRKRLD